MKKFLVVALLLASTAHANRISELTIMATEDVEETLDLRSPDYTYKILSQGFGQAGEGADTAIVTVVKLQNLITGQTNQWTCTTQFAKTPKFFEILSTICN